MRAAVKVEAVVARLEWKIQGAGHLPSKASQRREAVAAISEEDREWLAGRLVEYRGTSLSCCVSIQASYDSMRTPEIRELTLLGLRGGGSVPKEPGAEGV